jgi:hypothetical protein
MSGNSLHLVTPLEVFQTPWLVGQELGKVMDSYFKFLDTTSLWILFELLVNSKFSALSILSHVYLQSHAPFNYTNSSIANTYIHVYRMRAFFLNRWKTTTLAEPGFTDQLTP